MWCENFNSNNLNFSYCECSNTEQKTESTERVGVARVSSKKILRGIIRVFCNIYIETHNTIYSIEGVGAI